MNHSEEQMWREANKNNFCSTKGTHTSKWRINEESN